MKLTQLIDHFLLHINDKIGVRIVKRTEDGTVTHYKHIPISYFKHSVNFQEEDAPHRICVEQDEIDKCPWIPLER